MATIRIDPSDNAGVVELTGYADQAFVAELWVLQPLGTQLSSVPGGVEERGRVYAPLDCRQYASYDAEMRPDTRSQSTVSLSVFQTASFPYNELTFAITAADAATMQNWPVSRGEGMAMGVLSGTGERTPLLRWRWRIRNPSAART